MKVPLGPLAGLATALILGAQGFAHPNFAASIERPLRYAPDAGDFVIVNGAESFNRPLYGCNSAFRIDAGDIPEFSLYLPGRGGNLRLGVAAGGSGKWINSASRTLARYHPGEMIYEISDPILGGASLQIAVLPMAQTQGVILQARLDGSPGPVTLLLAFGGANGQRGKRDGDIGCEDEPVSQFFQLRPEFCEGNQFELGKGGFILHAKTETLAGVGPATLSWRLGDGNAWSNPQALFASAPSNAPVVMGKIKIEGPAPVYFAIERIGPSNSAVADLPTYEEVSKDPTAKPQLHRALSRERAHLPAELPGVFDEAIRHRDSVANRLTVATPDPFIDAAAGALCIASDAVWDESQGVFMHGAVAWRTKLLGWRGPYSADELGWHDRAERHLSYWATRQNTSPVPAALMPADLSSHLSRNETSLHSNGDMSNSHYDMNLVYIDALFRHFLWTGDLALARNLWPVIVRHIAWEKRLFRRPFGPHQLPLYEGYCCIWASDDVAYDGGGATHATAYNYYHNRMAARLARMLGEDPLPYDLEAGLIGRALKTYLWLPDRGWYAESKDLLGLQQVHADPALWTFYHAVDSEAATPLQAWQMSRFIDTQIAHIPVIGPGVPKGDFYTLPTTNWMPYQWSTNNVVMAEAAHTALALWEAGRDDDAYRLFKGCLLDSMYLGLCPGNAGMCTGYDMARGEAQRDFADASGVCSRTLVEGLFGVHPDALAGEIVLRPGFPSSWDHAHLRQTDFDFEYSKQGPAERIRFTSHWVRPMAVRLQLKARKDSIESVRVNGNPAAWKLADGSVGFPLVEIRAEGAKSYDIEIAWTGADLARPVAGDRFELDSGVSAAFGAADLLEVADPQGSLGDLVLHAHAFTGTAEGLPGARSVFAHLKQGQLTWWAPVEFEIETKKARIRPDTAATHFEPVDLHSYFNDRVTEVFHHDYSAPRSPYCSLALPSQGFGSWCHPLATYTVDDTGLREASDRGHGRLVMPNGVPFETPGTKAGNNILFTSQWTQFPSEVSLPLGGHAQHAYLLMAGSTNALQSGIENGEVVVTYTDGSADCLSLANPKTWWPIDQDYQTDDYAFRRDAPVPLRVDLRTGLVRSLSPSQIQGRSGQVRGGAATVLDLPLDPSKTLRSLNLRACANEVVIGLMSLTLAR